MSNEPSTREDTNRTVLVFSNDLFFAMRIRDALRQAGYSTVIVKTEAEFASAVANDKGLVLGIVDFNHAIDWDQLADALADSETPTIAFGPHKDTAGFGEARRAGVTRVISNGAFTSSLPDLVQKYALPMS